MSVANSGEGWSVDFGVAAKVRPALLLTGNPADDKLDLVTVLLHTTSLRGNRWELSIAKPFLKPGAFHLQQIQGVLNETEMNQVLDALAERLRI
jgi:mRNA interferase MazF